MGEVYRAQDTKLGRDVALKVLPEELAREPERRKRFEREARAVAALKHPNIVTIHSVEEADGVHFITMELVEGETLSDIIPQRGLALDRFFDLAIPLADAVSSAHAKGIAHRDLKPANIMLDADGRLKVLDFGLAKLFEPGTEADQTVGSESDTAEGRILGTAAYMSPEQAEGDTVDHRSDVFSLGIIFYEMVTGDRPFKGKTSISTISAVLRETPLSVSDIKPGLPRHLGRIIKRCLAKDPDRRYQTVLDLRNDLRDLKEEEQSPVATGVSDMDIGQTGERRRPESPASVGPGKSYWKYILPAAVIMIAVVLVVTFLPGRGPQESTGVMRLAVLPFENLGASEDEYFADGITDEITAKLAGIPGLAVISRASAKKYKNTDKGLQVVGQELGADYILEGTIRWDKREGREKVRITPQLIDVSDDIHLWAENYEREIDEIFVVQADIAKEIADALGVKLAGGEDAEDAPAATDNVEAYQAYLRAAEYDSEDESGIRLSIDLLSRAVDLDSRFAIAWAELSRNHSAMHHYGYESTHERLALSRAAVDRALELDPDLPDAHIALAYYYYWGHREYNKALEALAVAEEMVPNDSRVLAATSFVLRRQGKLEECLDYMKRAVELDPQNAVLIRDVGFTYQMMHRFDEALPYLERAVAVSPDYLQTYTMVAEINLLKGEVDAARRALQAAPKKHENEYVLFSLYFNFILRNYDEVIAGGLNQTDRIAWAQNNATPVGYWVGRAHDEKGQRNLALPLYRAAQAALEREIEARPQDYRMHSSLGLVLAAMGQKDEAIRAGKQGLALMPVTKDVLIGSNRVIDMAQIYALVGESDLALDTIEYLLENPSDFSIARVRLDPTYDSLRDHPRYPEILAKYGQRVP
jgi:TolB-like protein/Tfp pilus assembly protein PilF